MVNSLFFFISKFLYDNGYVILCKFLWGKHVKTEKVTGNMIIVNLIYNTITVLKLKDRFLFVKRAPNLELVNTKYSTVTEFKRIVMQNEKTQLEFLKKQKEWSKRK